MSIGLEPTRDNRAPVSRRWIVLLVVSLLLHFIVLGSISGHVSTSALREQNPTTITAQLHQAQRSEPIVAPKPKPAQPKPTAQPKPKANPKPTPQQTPSEPGTAIHGGAASAPQSNEGSFDLAEVSQALLALEKDNSSFDNPPINEPIPETESALPAKPDLPRYKISIPPSAELKYDVQALRDGQMVYGSGKISWQSDGSNYTVNGEASILFFTLLNFKSAGVIDDFGVAPVLYSEKRFRRSETNTHFHRERSTISFSASTATYPRNGGEQDRASIVWQLTGIGRGDGEKFQPGAEIDFFVAGVRDAAPWRVRVIGEEQVDIGTGKVLAWHVVRIPKQGTYDQKLDIWLAPQHEWYPVKLRFTETNGEYLDMLLSNLTMNANN